jgi:hypothetical protein
LEDLYVITEAILSHRPSPKRRVVENIGEPTQGNYFALPFLCIYAPRQRISPLFPSEETH